MANFQLDTESMMDSSKMADSLVREIHKDIDKVTQGKPLSTSRSDSKFGQPQQLTVFSVSQILQGVPAYASPTETLGRYQTLVESSYSQAREGTPIKEYIHEDLVPDDVKRSLQAMEDAEKLQKGETETGTAGAGTATDGVAPDGSPTPGGGATGTTPTVSKPASAAQVDDIERHPNIHFQPGGGERVVPDARAGRIDGKVISVIKFLGDNGGAIWITSGKRSGSGRSAHNRGLGLDCKPVPQAGDIRKYRDECTVFYALLDTLTGEFRPKQVGGPYLYKPQNRTWSDGTAASLDKLGTEWFCNQQHWNHIHIGY